MYEDEELNLVHGAISTVFRELVHTAKSRQCRPENECNSEWSPVYVGYNADNSYIFSTETATVVHETKLGDGERPE